MDSLIFNLYQYFFGKNQQTSKPEDHYSKDYLMEQWNSISTSTTQSKISKHSIEMYPSRDEIDAFSLYIENKSKDTTLIKDQIPQCTELYQCLQNTVKELEDQKFIFDTQFKGLTLNLNNNNIRLIAVENDVKNITLKYMGLSQMFETLRDQLEMVSGKINVKFDHLEQMLSYNTAECYGTSDIPENL